MDRPTDRLIDWPMDGVTFARKKKKSSGRDARYNEILRKEKKDDC